MKIAVAGATGRVGHHIAEVLTERGHDVVPISRGHGVDVITGEGLDAALEGADVIVDAATGPTPEQDPATEFFTTAARNLQAAGERAGVRHIVVVSIIGIDAFKGGYNAAKVAQEQAHLAGPVPVRILRAAQFHEFVEQVLDWGTRDEVAYVPKWPSQLVAARSVAEAAADLAVSPEAPAAVVEVAGPRAEDFSAMAVLVASRRGGDVKVQGVTDPSDPDSALMEAGGLLPGPGAIIAGPTFEEWLNAS